MENLSGKVMMVTGGTSGIGRETAIGLAKMGAHVIVTGRNPQRGAVGIADIQQRSGSEHVDLLLADFSQLDEVRRLAADVRDKYDRLDVLVNNVGLLPSTRYITVDGIEATLAVNHVAPFVLTHELLPLLKSSAPSRVINVTGGAPLVNGIDFDNLQAQKGFTALTTYSQAKMVLEAASYAFAKRLEGSGVALNVAYPGPATTNMTKNMSPDMIPWAMRPMWPIFRLFQWNASPVNASVSSIYLASSPEVEGVSGAYFNRKAQRKPWNSRLVDGDVPERVWEETLKLVDVIPVTI